MNSQLTTLEEEATQYKSARKFAESRIFLELETLAKELNAPSTVVEDAFNICRQLIASNFVAGRRCCTTVMASFYASCRKNEFPISLRDLARVDRQNKVDWRDIAHCYRMIARAMRFDIPVVDPSRYLVPIGGKTNSSSMVINISRALIAEARSDVEGSDLTGKDPRAVAAAALYITTLAIGERLREKDLADAAGITESAVRHSVVALRKMHFLDAWLESVFVEQENT